MGLRIDVSHEGANMHPGESPAHRCRQFVPDFECLRPRRGAVQLQPLVLDYSLALPGPGVLALWFSIGLSICLYLSLRVARHRAGGRRPHHLAIRVRLRTGLRGPRSDVLETPISCPAIQNECIGGKRCEPTGGAVSANRSAVERYLFTGAASSRHRSFFDPGPTANRILSDAESDCADRARGMEGSARIFPRT
jgi:hypothetical protein